MQPIQWDPSLSIGVTLIDEQHQMLVQRLGDLGRAIDSSQGEARISEMLNFMIEYTDFHFSAEEAHMAAHAYPGLAAQQKQHKAFKGMLRQLVDDFREEGATKALATSINVFLTNWLIQHIQGVDAELGTFLNEKGVTLTDAD